MLFSLLVRVIFVLNATKCARILATFPTPFISHQQVFQVIWKELSLRGHQVTVLTPNPLNDSTLTNLTEIDTSSTYDIMKRSNFSENMSQDKSAIKVRWWVFHLFERIALEHLKVAEPTLKNPDLEFDLILAEPHVTFLYGLKCKFNVPVITISSLGIFYQTHDAVGNPSHPLIVSKVVSALIGELTFYNKLASIFHYLLYRGIYYWYVWPRSDKIMREFWGECPYIGDLERKIDFVLTNTNPILHPVGPNVPNVAEMRQLHINHAKELPQELQEYLDTSTQGVIYFSLGSIVKGIEVFSKNIKIISDALSELPYNVLWKWENDSLPDKPKNVMIMKWFPQQDVLAHKNIKVFVTHGGLLSMEEAITSGVPIVGIPFMSEQHVNIKHMVSMGLGKIVDHMEITQEGFRETILDVAENKTYRTNVLKMKNVLTDGSLNSLENTVWWIEYVLRHKGAVYLRSPAADLSWFEYYLMDVVILFLFALLASSYFVVRYFRIVFRNFIIIAI